MPGLYLWWSEVTRYRLSKGEIPGLTGVRGLAATAVVAYHFFGGVFPLDSSFERAIRRGYLSVDVFFVLSGFVLAMNYGRLFEGRFGFAVWADFMKRRVARIYPIYLVVLFCQLILVWLYHHGVVDVGLGAPRTPSSVEIAANLLLVQAWGVARSLLGQTWSVSTEMAAYVVFPLFVWAVLRAAPVRAIAVMALSFCLILLIAWQNGGGDLWGIRALDTWDGTTALPLLRCFAGFVLGMGVWRLSAHLRPDHYVFSDGAGIAILCAIAALTLSPLPDIALYPLFAPLILCLSRNRGRVAEFFGWRPVHFLGTVSFSLYLLQGFLISPARLVARRLLPSAGPAVAWGLGWLLLLLLLVGASAVTYRWIEKPGRRLVHRRSGSGAISAQSAAPVAGPAVPGP
jgi:peptidoglycan/LPS O-acetylase OafA/YrhL